LVLRGLLRTYSVKYILAIAGLRNNNQEKRSLKARIYLNYQCWAVLNLNSQGSCFRDNPLIGQLFLPGRDSGEDRQR